LLVAANSPVLCLRCRCFAGAASPEKITRFARHSGALCK